MNEISVHTQTVNGLTVRTGDIICTQDGVPNIPAGQFWRVLGKLIPGAVDHVAVYIGPDGQCIEAGQLGVISFTIPGERWDAAAMADQRGDLYDTLYGVAYPLEGRQLSPEEDTRVRLGVAGYCLSQVGKHYNLNFFDSDTEECFYCSQLAYKAFLPFGVDLNTGQGVPNLPGTGGIVFPQEIWSGCHNRRAE